GGIRRGGAPAGTPAGTYARDRDTPGGARTAARGDSLPRLGDGSRRFRARAERRRRAHLRPRRRLRRRTERVRALVPRLRRTARRAWAAGGGRGADDRRKARREGGSVKNGPALIDCDVHNSWADSRELLP